jgi:phosphatidylglycerol:prolipoprotein diacylglycerol transferase
MYPPDDRYLVYQLFGLITIHWYAVCILGGAMLGAWFGARRAASHGYNPDDAWNILGVGLITSILCARAWYAYFEWDSFVAARADYASTWQWLLFRVINPAGGGGGIAIQGAIIGAVIGCWIYTKFTGLDFLRWTDFGAPCMAIGQAIGRWGNFFNQEAYGRPMGTPQPWGLRIDDDRRIHEYTDLAQFPVETTRFHPTFLYESVWNVLVLIGVLVVERRLRGWLKKGDLFLFYAMFYSIGRFFIEGLRTDSLCTNRVGGACENALRTAQVTALVTIGICCLILAVRHLRRGGRDADDATLTPVSGA